MPDVIMGLFGFGKKSSDVLDLAERYRQQKERESSASDEEISGNSESDIIDLSQPQEKKKKLAKRILDMTNKIEGLSSQIYLLQQRIEVLERKNDVNKTETGMQS